MLRKDVLSRDWVSFLKKDTAEPSDKSDRNNKGPLMNAVKTRTRTDSPLRITSLRPW
jgi:hypothetical protein